MAAQLPFAANSRKAPPSSYLRAHEGTAAKLSRTGPKKNLVVTANGSRLGSRFALTAFQPAAEGELT
jgi:hypothetical protein